jgi:copper(I)-binding protein
MPDAFLARRRVLGGAAALLLASGAAHAQGQEQGQAYSQGDIRITAPWARAAGRGATGGGFLTLQNTGRAPDRLLAVRAGFARSVELHTSIREGEVMRMRPVTAIDLPPRQEVRLAPGGMHIMLIGLGAPLERGSRVPVTLVFERAGSIEVQLEVQGAGARGPAAAAGHGQHGHGH